jgi:hypothetical protein
LLAVIGQLSLEVFEIMSSLDGIHLGVKWFERLRLSSSRKTASSERPRATLPAFSVEQANLVVFRRCLRKEIVLDALVVVFDLLAPTAPSAERLSLPESDREIRRELGRPRPLVDEAYRNRNSLEPDSTVTDVMTGLIRDLPNQR